MDAFIRYFERVRHYDMLPEAVAASILLIALLFLLFSVVIPNFGHKSVAISWMTVLGGVIIFCYSVFVELRDEHDEVRFNTCVIFDKKGSPISFLAPFTHIGGTGNIIEYQHTDALRIKSSLRDMMDQMEVGSEILTLNALSYLSADFKDWKKNQIRTPGNVSTHFRSPEAAGKDCVFYENDVLNNAKFHRLIVNIEPNSELPLAYSIFPEGTSISAECSILAISNHNFEVRAEVQRPTQSYAIQTGTEENLFLTPYEVRLRVRLPKRTFGNIKRESYKALCSEIVSGLQAALEVPEKSWPERRGLFW